MLFVGCWSITPCLKPVCRSMSNGAPSNPSDGDLSRYQLCCLCEPDHRNPPPSLWLPSWPTKLLLLGLLRLFNPKAFLITLWESYISSQSSPSMPLYNAWQNAYQSASNRGGPDLSGSMCLTSTPPRYSPPPPLRCQLIRTP